MRPSSIVLASGALLAAAAVVATAQIPTVPPGRSYAFEIASVKPSDPDERLRVFDFKPTGSLTARNLTLHRLIAAAYGTPFPIPLPDERIVGGPEWLTTARFAVEARSAAPPDAATAARDIGFMLRTLLADRFALRVRPEPRMQRVYALVRVSGTAKAGVTLRPSASECDKNPAAGCGMGGGPGRLQMHGATLDLLAFTLQEVVGRPVIDRTGLTGVFDGTLEWAPSPDEMQAVFGGAPARADAAAGPSIFTAVEEQLGLKLQDARAPIETLVVTHAELPSPN
jgi:bla regulator protein BlaR1